MEEKRKRLMEMIGEKNPADLGKFQQLQWDIFRSLCWECKRSFYAKAQRKKLMEFSEFCEDCQKMAKGYEKKLNDAL